MSQSPENGENVISLQSISRNFLSALQRQHDMLAFSLAGFRTADPKAYEFYSKVSRVMPAPQFAQCSKPVSKVVAGELVSLGKVYVG